MKNTRDWLAMFVQLQDKGTTTNPTSRGILYKTSKRNPAKMPLRFGRSSAPPLIRQKCWFESPSPTSVGNWRNDFRQTHTTKEYWIRINTLSLTGVVQLETWGWKLESDAQGFWYPPENSPVRCELAPRGHLHWSCPLHSLLHIKNIPKFNFRNMYVTRQFRFSQ